MDGVVGYCTIVSMPHRFHGNTDAVPSTQRIELFTDAVFAILITLLILEVKLPFSVESSSSSVLKGLAEILPHLFSFAFSFFALAVFWVNHHHFFHSITKTDWVLLWHNMHLLFWLTLVPFTTGMLGEHPGVALAVAVYAANLGLAATAFALMAQHALFHGCFTNGDVPEKERRAFVRRALLGAGAYALAAVLAFGSPFVTWIMILAIPAYYVVPRLLRR